MEKSRTRLKMSWVEDLYLVKTKTVTGWLQVAQDRETRGETWGRPTPSSGRAHEAWRWRWVITNSYLYAVVSVSTALVTIIWPHSVSPVHSVDIPKVGVYAEWHTTNISYAYLTQSLSGRALIWPRHRPLLSAERQKHGTCSGGRKVLCTHC